VARDPYKYFRVEARELVDGLSGAALKLEKGIGGAEELAGMFRLAHTLKGASRVVRQAAIADLAHAIEDLLEPHRHASSGGLSADQVDRLLRLLDDVSSRLAALEPAAAPAPEAGARTAPESLRTVRIEIEEMDALFEGLSEAAVRLAGVRRDLGELARARRVADALIDQLPSSSRARSSAEELRGLLVRVERGLDAGVHHTHREIAQVRDRADQLRLLPASAAFPTLERAARDAAHALGRSIVFEATGGECRLEAGVLFALRDALLHVVRNAVAHGIEPETERRRAGKPSAGRVALEVVRRGHRVAFLCSDDGRGIDADSVLRAAVARGVTTAREAAAMQRDQVLMLALENGVTTTDRVTDVSGRGVGLDVLRATVGELKGDVKLTSEPGRGTTIELSVPVSISSIAALAIEVDGMTFSVPLDSVQRSLRLAAGDIAHFADHDSVVVDGAVVPFLPLARVVGGERREPQSAWSAVLVQAGARSAVIGADRLVGTSSIVLRPLPQAAGLVPLAAGVSLDADGDPRLVLDPRGLVDAALAGRASGRSASSAKPRAPVLIVDDSLTTRMLEQSILESAGYAVDLATSAEEGFVRAREAPHSLFLVDVEMPGMDGFEFVSRTRADPLLGAVPAILVSSRDGEADRRRGEEVGAKAYIVKGEFDQESFLRTVRQLIG
jgi:two-component system chemotaxis sensor kinase CheA